MDYVQYDNSVDLEDNVNTFIKLNIYKMNYTHMQ